MKRKSTKTGEFFKRGDKRADGRVFIGYTTNVKKNGYFTEVWGKPEALAKLQSKDKARKASSRPVNHNRLPYGSAKLFKGNQKAIKAYREFALEPPTQKDLLWLDEDILWVAKYFI
jgi:hypothetical protein